MSVQACAELVQRGDPDRFMAVMAAPPQLREKLFPLYAFNVEVARAPWVTQEPMIAEMRLQWWRDALDEIAKGGSVRKHEVVTPLAPFLDDNDCSSLDRLIQARRWDIYRDAFEDGAHFDSYLDATAGTLLWTACRHCGAQTGETEIRQIAWASGLANWFLAIPELESRARIPLVDGRAEAIQKLAKTGLAKLSATPVPKLAKPALLATWRTKAILKQVVRSPGRVAAGALSQSEFAKKISLLWRAI